MGDEWEGSCGDWVKTFGDEQTIQSGKVVKASQLTLDHQSLHHMSAFPTIQQNVKKGKEKRDIV